MEVKNPLLLPKPRLQVESQPAASVHRTGNLVQKSHLVPFGLQGKENRRIDTLHDDLQSTRLPRSFGSSLPVIMVVEDNQSLAAMLQAALRSWGYEVCVARNGQEGLVLLDTYSIAAILLDLRMPVMDGRTMLNELRWAGHTMPVLVMSGGMESQALRRLLNEGAQGFLIKPFGLYALKQALPRP